MVGGEQKQTNDLSIMETGQKNILIVKLGAFGNIILSLGAGAVIRQHHAGARITIGNKAGTKHLIARHECAAIMLFLNDANPSQCASSARRMRSMPRSDLGDLPVDAILRSLPV